MSTDYFYNLNKYKELNIYVNRRLDLYNVMGSTVISIISGLVFGFAYRIIIFHEEITLKTIYANILNIHNKIFISKELNSLPIEIYILIIMSFIVSMFLIGMRRVGREHDKMTLLIIKNVVKGYKDFDIRAILGYEFFTE